MNNPENTAKPGESENEIVSTRLFTAPRELVFKAWTDPQALAQWWGPKGFTNTFHEFDFRPRGTWDFIMHGPDGTNYKNKSVFVEIDPLKRIVFDHVSPPEFRVIATFADEAGKTRLTFRMIFVSASTCANLKDIIIPSNEENFDRLEAQLGKMGK